MQLLGVVFAVILYLIVLLLALGLNEADVALSQQNRETPGGADDLWMMSTVGFGLMIVSPLLPLAFMTDLLSSERALSMEPWIGWLAFNAVVFVATRRYVYRPLMRDLDARRSNK